MAMLIAKVIAGDFTGRVDIKTKHLFCSPAAENFKGLRFHDGGATYHPDQVKRVVQLSSEQAKSFMGSAITGVAGGLLLGGAGLIAGALVGGKKTIARIGIELDDGKKVILEQEFDDKYLQCLLNYAKANGIMEQDLGF